MCLRIGMQLYTLHTTYNTAGQLYTSKNHSWTQWARKGGVAMQSCLHAPNRLAAQSSRKEVGNQRELNEWINEWMNEWLKYVKC